MTQPGPGPQPTPPYPGYQPAAPTQAAAMPPVPPPAGRSAPQPGWGAPAQPQQAWGQPVNGQPVNGQPVNAQQPYQAWGPGQGAPAAVAVPKSGKGKLLGSIGGGVAAVAIGIGAFAVLGTGEPAVGDCITPTDESFDVVACDSADAQFKVIGVQEEKQSQEEFFADPGVCAAFPATEYAAWYGTTGEEGTVYCAGPL